MTAEDRFAKTLAAAREGDAEAWAALYRDLAPRLLGYLRARGAAEPEDVLGEVFVQAVRDLGGFTGGEREFRAWLFSIASNRLIDEGRHRSRRPSDPAPAETITALAGVGDAEVDALARLEGSEAIGRLRLLSTDQRTVLLLRVIGGMTVPEVARAIGKRPGAVKQLQRRGLERLRRELDEEADGG